MGSNRCHGCGKELGGSKMAGDREDNGDGCRHFCSKSCCEAFWTDIIAKGETIPECPCY